MNPFGLTTQQLTAFADPLLEYLPASLDPAAVSGSATADVASLAELAGPEVAAERIRRLGVEVPVERMTERLLVNDGPRAVISGLRYLNLDPASPFVALKSNFRINDPATVRRLEAQVLKTYGESRPLGFTFWEQPGLDLGQTEDWGLLVAGSTDVRRVGLPDGVEVQWPSTVDDFFADFGAERGRWTKSSPGLSRFVQAQGRDDLEEAARLGQLMIIRDAAGFAGLAAGRSEQLFGQPGLCMIELFLAERVRSRGWGKMLESQFIARHHPDFGTVWGQIHASNLPSLHTALSLGRTPLQQEYFVGLSAG